MATAHLDNNHGGMVQVNGQWYIFYHRHTNAHCFSRQGCAEPIIISDDGTIDQVRVSSAGLYGKPLSKGEYPASCVCHLFNSENTDKEEFRPYLTQNGKDGEECEQFVTNITNGAVIGFRPFDFKSISKVTVFLSGECDGCILEIATGWNTNALCRIPLSSVKTSKSYCANLPPVNGIHDLCFRFKGEGKINFYSFILE